jgi:pimeloyl-[acyl-carrier protein] methyl ester esterase
MNLPVKKLVLLPGMDGSVELLRGFAAMLPMGMETETLWYPTDQWTSFKDLAGTLRGALPVDEPFVLVAESFGVPLAILIAAMEPPNLKGVVLCSGYATSPVRGLKRNVVWDIAPLVSHVTLPGILAKYLMVGDEAPPELVQSVRDAVSWVTPKVLAGRVREALNVDVRGELAQVKVPVLYVQPTRDRLIHASCVEEMRLVKPGRTVEIIGPHLLLQAEPALCAEAVAQFVAKLAASSDLPQLLGFKERGE